MPRVARIPFYPLCLLAGALLFGGAGLAHPSLTGDGAAQLATIAATPAWRTIHWLLLLGLPLMLTGLVGFALRHDDGPAAPFARAGILTALFAFALWTLNVLFMVGAASSLARAYATSEVGITATQAVFVYDMLHPAGLAAERLATGALAIALYFFGWTALRGKLYPRWLGWSGWATAVVCAAVALFWSEFTLTMFYAQGVVVAWFAVTAVVMLLEAGPKRR